MKLLCLIDTEAEGICIRWSQDATKSRELIDAVLAFGFTSNEIEQSPIGVLEKDFSVSPTEFAKAGAFALMGINGMLLVQADR
jgi:hypothetical protein